MRKFIGCIISLCVISLVMNYFYGRENNSHDPGQNGMNYIVQLPKGMKVIYSLLFIAGILLTIFFLVVKTKWGGGVTDGHIWFALILAGIGIIVMAAGGRWKVSVKKDQMTVVSLGRTTRRFQISDIEKVEEGEDGEIMIYKNGKKIVTVERVSENYDRFKNTMRQYGKL